MGAPIATTSATLKCTFGQAPGSLIAIGPTVMAGNMPAAVITDMAPMSNVVPFGMCMSPSNPTVAAATAAALGVLTPMPCIPAPAGTWVPGSPTVLIGNKPALNKNCVLTCSFGGVISILAPGAATTVQVP